MSRTLPILVLSVYVAFLVLQCLAGEAEAQRRYKPKLKFCKVDMFLQCLLEPLSQFTSQANGSGIANSEEEMEQFCFNLYDYFPVCAHQWTKRCGSPISYELIFKLFVEPFRQSMKDFCDPEGPIRKEFLKYSTCLIHQVKLSPVYRRKCIRPLQASSEFIQEEASKLAGNKPAVYWGKNFCCSYNQWEACMDEQLKINCGDAAAKVFPNLIHHGSIFFLRGLCPTSHYDPTNTTQCNPAQFKAPEEYKPIGYNSKSIVSHIFSVSCPNVGFGIVPSRDF